MLETITCKLEHIRLYLHFSVVLERLRSDPAISRLVPEIQRNRKILLARLEHYRNGGIFPQHSLGGLPMPYFFDRDQRPCAVAALLTDTGKERIAREIANLDNHARVRAMPFTPLQNWSKHYGISKSDLARIQPQYYETVIENLPILILYFTRSRLRILKIAVVEVQECFYTPHSYEGGK